MARSESGEQQPEVPFELISRCRIPPFVLLGVLFRLHLMNPCSGSVGVVLQRPAEMREELGRGGGDKGEQEEEVFLASLGGQRVGNQAHSGILAVMKNGEVSDPSHHARTNVSSPAAAITKSRP